MEALGLGRTIRDWNQKYGASNTLRRVQEALGIPENPNRASRNEFTVARATQKIDPATISIGALAEGLLGYGWAGRWGATIGGHVLEASEAVDASAFANITGQLLVTAIQREYDNPIFIADKLIDTIPETAPVNLGVHKVPGISGVIDGPSLVNPGMPYPSSTVVEDWVSYPAVGKFGEVVKITLEAVLADRTGQLVKTESKLGYRSHYDQEEEQLSVMLGLTNNFLWKDTAYNTYLSSGSNWINKKTGQTVAGGTYAIINEVEQLFVQMLDPYTGKVITIDPSKMSLLCMPESKYDFKNITHATQTRTGAYGTSDPNRQLESPSPLDTDYPIYASPIARRLLIASGISAANVKNYFYLGDWKEAFVYREVLPWSVITAPPGNPDDFDQDIITKVKARRMGKTGVKNPRYSTQSIGS